MKKSIIYKILLFVFVLQGGLYGQEVISGPNGEGTEEDCTVVLYDQNNQIVRNFSTDSTSETLLLTVNTVDRCFSTFNATGFDDWVSLNQTVFYSSTSLTINISANNSPNSRRTIVSFTKESTTGEVMFFGGIGISQSGNSNYNTYYIDTDGDAFGDFNAPPSYGLIALTGYVDNNLDFCPNEYSVSNNGCIDASIDQNYNWTKSYVYNIDGKLIGASKGYFDDLGKGIQSQTYDTKTGKTWATQTMYDAQGRPALQTMSAPITSADSDVSFGYKEGFIQNAANIAFTSTDFESNDSDPSKVGTEANTVGAYYSSNGPEFQDTTDRPYSKTIYSDLNPGTIKQTIGGNKINGQWKQGYSFTMPAAQEMQYVFGYDYFPSNPAVKESYYNSLNSSFKYIHTSTEDLYTNHYHQDASTFYCVEEDKLILYGTQAINIKASEFDIEFGGTYVIKDDSQVNGTLKKVQISGVGSVYGSSSSNLNNYTILGKLSDCSVSINDIIDLNNVIEDTPKSVNWLKATKSVVEDVHGNEAVVFTDGEGKTLGAARSGLTDAQREDPSLTRVSYEVLSLIGEQKFVDIHIPEGCENTLSFIGASSNYKVYNLKTEIPFDVTPSTLSKGFYRIEYTGSTELTSAHQLTYIDGNTIHPVLENEAVGVRYRVNYYDFSLNYYNKIGQLTASLQPIGFNDACLSSLSAPVTHNENLKSTFTYNTLGQLITTTSPDEGEARFKYREDGQIRFSQNSKQALVNEFSFTNYDDLGRPGYSGVAVGTFNTLDPDAVWFNNTTSVKEIQATVYDDLYSSSDEWGFVLADFVDESGLDAYYKTPTFLAGNVAMTYNKQSHNDDNNEIVSSTFYSYDIYGRVTWILQNIKGLGTKTIDYEYDPVTSQVIKVIYQKGIAAEKFIHRYTYDEDDQSLIKVETSTNDINYTTHADYEYYETGALKRTELAGGIQGVDYVYNLAGQLKAINHPDLTESSDPGNDSNDLFGLTLDYYTGDYQRDSAFTKYAAGSNQYNGNVKSMTWNTQMNGEASQPFSYAYSYDRNNWLTAAIFDDKDNSQLSASSNLTFNTILNTSKNAKATQRITLEPGFLMEATGTNKFFGEIVTAAQNSEYGEGDYNVTDLSYDANGNIKTLHRKKNTEEIDGGPSNRMDELTYTYKEDKPNQLDYIKDQVDIDEVATNADDIKTQGPGNYEYNEIGQLTDNYEEAVKYEYNASGLVTKVYYNDALKVEFIYNDKNFRTRKISYGNDGENITDYIRDVTGSVLAIYEDQQLVELPIYGANRLGIYKKQAATNVYQLADHLGNVRSVIADNSQTLINSTFDNSVDGWAVAGSATRAHENGLLKVTTATLWQGVEKSSYNIPDHSDYTLSLHVDMETTEKVLVEVWQYDISGENLAKKGEIISTSGTHVVTGNITVGAERLRIKITRLDATGVSKEFFIDNVVLKTHDPIVALSATDYYPFGMPMPNRKVVNGEPYRYAYQGQEVDPETGKEAFQLRLWDARIGRWLTTDPAGQYASSYMGMGNNPMNGIDPDGAFWIDNGDGTWTAEKGDGAESLAKDAGIPLSEAYTLMEKQGYYTYFDSSDGFYKSSIYVGQKVGVSNFHTTLEVANVSNNPLSNLIYRNSWYSGRTPRMGEAYHYTKADLKTAIRLLNGPSNPIRTALMKRLAGDVLDPISKESYYLRYGHTVGNLKIADQYIEMAKPLLFNAVVLSFSSGAVPFRGNTLSPSTNYIYKNHPSSGPHTNFYDQLYQNNGVRPGYWPD